VSPDDSNVKSGGMKDESAHVSTGAEPAVRIVVPEKLDLHLSLDGIPTVLASAAEKFAKSTKPTPRLRTFLKDYLPALTPIATAVISVAISIYTYRANDHQSAEALDKIISEFGGSKEDDRARAIAAIKLATYGDKALPAVKMVLGSDDPHLRTGGVLVAKQMYRAKTMKRGVLTKEILGYYAENDRFLRRGVMEWLVEMQHQLSDEESRLAYDMIKGSFGDHAEKCAAQDETVALNAANFLFIWSFGDSKALVLGMAQNCRNDGARQTAINTIPEIAKSLSKEERDNLLKNNLPNLRRAAPEFTDLIDQAAAAIQKNAGAP
jgi:hypothetical protein